MDRGNLEDMDRRRSAGGDAAPGGARPVALPDRTLVRALVLGAAGIVRLVHYLVFARVQPLYGDEGHYYDRAFDVLELVRQLATGQDTGTSVAHLVDRGWFMPGMSIVLSPAVLLTSSVAAVRLYVGCLNFALLVAVVWLVRRRYGSRSALATAVLLGFFPGLICFSFTFWGESLAGLLVVAVLLLLAPGSPILSRGARPLATGALRIGLLVLIVVYLRPGYILLLPVVIVISTLSLLATEPRIRSALRRSLVSSAIVCAVVLLGIAPWSYALSRKKGGFFLTTTTVELNSITTFGRPNDVKAVRPDIKQRLFAWDAWISEKSARSGKSYAKVLSRERRRVLSRVDLRSYGRTMRRQLERFYLEENTHFERIARHVASDPAATRLGRSERLWATVWTTNSVVWRLLLLSVLALLVTPLSCLRENWWAALHFKVTYLALSVQPWVSVSSGRYHVGLIPLCVVALCVVTRGRFSAPPVLWRDDLSGRTLAERAVALLQVSIPVLVVSLVLLVWQPW